MANQVDTASVQSARAVLREIRHTPQKARRVVNLVRGMRVDEALAVLKFAPQSAGQDCYTLLLSAVANYKQKHPELRENSELWITEALVDEGITMKRFRPRAQGRGFRILKRASHITLEVSNAKKNSKVKSKAKKEVSATEKGATK